MALGSMLGRGVAGPTAIHGPSMGVSHKHPGGRTPSRRVAVLVRGTSWGRKHPSQIQLKFSNLLISTTTPGKIGDQPRRGWVHLVNRPHLKVVVDSQKQRKEASVPLDASRSPKSTDIDLKRRKPSLKITWGVPLTIRIVLIYLVHSCENRVWMLNVAEETVRDFLLYVFRFGGPGLSVSTWQNYLKLKGWMGTMIKYHDVMKGARTSFRLKVPLIWPQVSKPGLGTEFTDCKMKLKFMELRTYQCFKYFLLSLYLEATRFNWYFTFISQDKFSLTAKTTVRYREVKLCVRVTKMQIEFSTLLKSQVFGTDEIHVRNSKSENMRRVFPHD